VRLVHCRLSLLIVECIVDCILPVLTATQRLKATVIAGLASPAIGLLCRTLTWHVEGAEHYDAALAIGRPPILACWHSRILPGLYYFRNRGIVALASQNFDGEWISRILVRYGYGTARGSSSRGGARALVQMKRDLSEGRPVVFTVDGPRGPARIAQSGAAWLSGASGHPILPFHLEADRAWTTGSWDRGQVPKLFAKVVVILGAPIGVPGTADPEVEEGRKEIERALGDLETRARRVLEA
jgi:lysophospholipid acyltransferase (LPLAT)-like uncharacterized protein